METEIEAQIDKILHAILELSRKLNSDWVSWRKISKQIEGSEEFADMVSAWGEMASAQNLVVTNSRHVSLTAKGLERVKNQQASGKQAQVSPQPALNSPEMIAATVKKYAARLPRLKYPIQQIAKVAHTEKHYVHAVFLFTGDTPITHETPVEFWPKDGGGSTRGKVVGQDMESGMLYVAFERELLPINLPASLSVDRAYLLNQLAQRLARLDHSPFLLEQLRQPTTTGFHISNSDSAQVGETLAVLKTPWTRFLWGPPGAGKSYALARLMIRLLQQEPEIKILLVAPSNLAVDVTILQLKHQIVELGFEALLRERKILRYGYPRKFELLESEELLGSIHQDQQTQKIRMLSRRLNLAEKQNASDTELAIIRTELFAAQEDLRKLVEQHLQSCAVVGTTTTLAYLPTSPISQIQWGNVFVDEVTMVPPATCVLLSSMANRRMLLAGDPRQLGPVYDAGDDQSLEDFEWMGRDIFDKSGLSRGSGENRHISSTDFRLARITSQRRCNTDIWRRVQHLYTEVENKADPDKLQPILDLPPWPGKGAVLMDITEAYDEAFCEKSFNSWQNVYTATLALELASSIVAELPNPISVVIITPYRAQAKLIQNWLRVEKKFQNPMVAQIQVGTVHQYQGSEADVVIFDMVDGVGRNRLGQLLRHDTGVRLTNVAFTRARGKLIVLANKAWCKEKLNRDDNRLLWEYILGPQEKVVTHVLPPKDLIKDRRLQVTESPIEAVLLEAMLQEKTLAEVSPQYVIRDFSGTIISRADFAFPNLKYAIYCDGARWHLQQDRWQRDLRQRNRLTEIGWRFSVFSGHQILETPKQCVAQIISTIDQLHKSQ